MKFRRVHLAALSVYALLSLLLTWPLASRLTTHVPGIAQWAFDESTFIWNIWYLKDALVDRLSSPLHSELIWYPLGIDLVLYTYNFYHALVAQPLAVAVNLPLASNVALLSSTVLSGYGTLLLVWYLLTRQRRTDAVQEDEGAVAPPGDRRVRLTDPPLLAAFVAGLVYAFASNRAIYAALGHYDMVTTQWIPFYALMLLRTLDATLDVAQRRRAAALAGLFFAFTGLAEMISALFLAMFTLIVLLVTGLAWYRQRRGRAGATGADAVTPRRPLLESPVTMLLIAGVVAVLIWSPVLAPILRQFLTDDFSLKGWGEAIPLSTDLLGWFTPTVLHPLWGGDLVAELRRIQELAQQADGVGFRDINTVFLGWVTLTLALLAVVRYGRRVAIWSWTALVFGLFTLGPFLQINGRFRFDLDGVIATFPLPFALLHYLPIIKANRAPNRNSVLLMLGLAVLVGYAIYWILQRGAQREPRTRTPQLAIGLALAALLVFEHLAIPAPLSDARIPAVYQQIAADPRPVSVLQVPLGWRNSFGVFGPEETRLQYFQTVHGKPMLGGNISRAPDFKLDYFQRIPYFQALTEIEFGRPVAPEVMEAASAQAADLAYLYDLGYVLLFPPIPARYPYVETWAESWAFLKSTMPLESTPFWSGAGIEAYRVVQPPGSDQFLLDLGGADRAPYLGEGWDASESVVEDDITGAWATARQSQLFVPLRQVDPNAEYTVRLHARPFTYPGSATQRASLMINGTPLGEQSLNDGWQELTWVAPGALLVDGLNRLTINWAEANAPRTVLAGSRLIGNTGVELPVDGDLKAFADGGFIALFDEEGQQINGSAGRQGVNVTVIDPQSGEVVDAVGFDTTANEFESARLVEFLRQIEVGAPVLVVSHGDATAFLNEEAIAGLRGIGADVTDTGLAAQYFAIAGVQGAQPGTAALVVDPTDAFLRLSLNRDRRPLAALVDMVQIEPNGP